MCFNFWKKQKAYAGDRAKAIMHAGERMIIRLTGIDYYLPHPCCIKKS
jgi:hypothetical protein